MLFLLFSIIDLVLRFLNGAASRSLGCSAGNDVGCVGGVGDRCSRGKGGGVRRVVHGAEWVVVPQLDPETEERGPSVSQYAS